MTNSEEANQRQASAVERLKGARRLLPSWVLSNTTAAAALTGAGLFAFVSTWFLLSPAVEYADRSLLIALIVGNFVIAAGFAGLIGVRVWHVWSDRRNHLAGSRTHVQLVGLFSIVAVTPAIIAFLFAFTILRSSLNDVFGERIENYQNTARDLANALVEIKANELQRAMREIAYDIRRNESAGVGLEATPISFRQYVYAQAEFRNLAAILLFDGNRNLLVRAEVEERRYNLPSSANLDGLKEGEPGEFAVVGVNDEKNDMFRGALSLEDYGGGFMIVYQPIDEKTTSRLFAVGALRDDWEEAKVGRSRAERVFLAGYVTLAVIILFGAIWIGLWAATRIVQPIGRLVQMAERVSGGDLKSRVEVYRDDGELGVLARSMNHMTAQLQTQRDDLVETNKQFDRRRRFTEAVLSGVSAGVVGLASDGRITIANRSAGFVLGSGDSDLTGVTLSELLPEAMALFEQASLPPFDVVSDQIEVDRDGRKRALSIRIVSDEVDGERSYVATFDDITELISAQRSAAWGDVARRIAHEIKNPLTPIQLSAERLRRKYLGEIQNSPDIFDKCTETIIRHVGDIGRMVDEFSSFARMPKPVIAPEDMRELIRSAVFPQKVAFADIEFKISTPQEPVAVRCDGRLIAQALGNLLKNAAESIGGRVAASPELPGRILVNLSSADGFAVIEVMDNGVGLPKAERHRLTEPYMTTRAKGTGLGLAIVNKVVEDHEGTLVFDDCDVLGPSGAKVTMRLPLVAANAAAAAAE